MDQCTFKAKLFVTANESGRVKATLQSLLGILREAEEQYEQIQSEAVDRTHYETRTLRSLWGNATWSGPHLSTSLPQLSHCPNLPLWLSGRRWATHPSLLLLLASSICEGSPPSGGYGYHPKPQPFLPAPPGETPSCAKHGRTYCEYIENYPT
ncbi:unnamed protein product [Nezara viridula]|uniref:Uncharacterized protein n=1 Tax=Nezara viridula TaxID=85310 RepID=A0A9P0E413_NEZVI|nr:unnamed protein product [Nezara viridula]